MNFLRGKKTYLVSGLLVLVSIVNFVSGDMTLAELLSSGDLVVLLNGFGLAAMRKGISG